MEGKIVIFIPTLTSGGAERVASILANEWCQKYSVTVITYFENPSFYKISDRVRHICLGRKANKNSIARIIDVGIGLVRLRRIIVGLKPIFVLSFMNKYNCFCLASMLGSGIPVVVSERDSPTEKLPTIRVLARKMLYRFAAGVICQTEDGKKFIDAEAKNRCSIVISNPINKIVDVSARRPEKVILNVSRLVRKKGHIQLLEAFAKSGLEDWTLVLCGEGEERERIKDHARSLGVDERVVLMGLTEDLSCHFKTAGIFAFSSLYEGYPNALAEAMVSGIPCVSYDCPTGPSEIIKNGVNGLLVPVGDVGGLARCLRYLATDSEYAETLGMSASNIYEHVKSGAIAAEYLNFCIKVSRVDRVSSK
ncbi:MAG: glycosyltransferase [Caldilineaceae bacterium]|nr:glycosyltransferase [Caldilineaceae bacterium]